MEAKVGDYRLQMSYDRIYDSVESVISNTSDKVHGIALSEGEDIEYVMVMPQKYVEWTSTDKQVMTEWEDICTAWMGFVIPINKDGVENIIQSIVDDGIIHPDSKEIEKMRKAFLNSDNHYYSDY